MRIPWTFWLFLVLFLVAVFAGMFLTIQAANLPYESFTSVNEGNRDQFVQWEDERAQDLRASAALMYDIAKVVAGATIAVLTSLVQPRNTGTTS